MSAFRLHIAAKLQKFVCRPHRKSKIWYFDIFWAKKVGKSEERSEHAQCINLPYMEKLSIIWKTQKITFQKIYTCLWSILKVTQYFIIYWAVCQPILTDIEKLYSATLRGRHFTIFLQFEHHIKVIFLWFYGKYSTSTLIWFLRHLYPIFWHIYLK